MLPHITTISAPGLYLGIGERLEPVACVAVRCGGTLLVRADGDHGWSKPETRFPVVHWLATYAIPFPLPDLPRGWYWHERGGWLRGLAACEVQEAALPVLLRAEVAPATAVSRENPFDPEQACTWRVSRHALGVEIREYASGASPNFAEALTAAKVSLLAAVAEVEVERATDPS